MELLADILKRLRGSGSMAAGPSGTIQTTPTPPDGWESWGEMVERCVEVSGLPPASRETMRLEVFNAEGNRTLKAALEAASVMARGGPPLMLTLCGPRGVGKTHLAVAIAWEWIERGAWVMYWQVPEMLERLRSCYDHPEKESFEDLFVQLQRCHLLILDDLGMEKASGWADVTLDRLVDWRYMRDRPLVVATNALDEELPPRIADRLWDTRKGQVVMMKASSYRRRAVGKQASTTAS